MTEARYRLHVIYFDERVITGRNFECIARCREVADRYNADGYRTLIYDFHRCVFI